jgi:hypothetical protein
MRACAVQLCKLKPKTRDAVVMVRRFRTGREAPADSLQLANEVIHLVNDYMQRHPSVEKKDILDAMRTAHAQVERDVK